MVYRLIVYNKTDTYPRPQLDRRLSKQFQTSIEVWKEFLQIDDFESKIITISLPDSSIVENPFEPPIHVENYNAILYEIHLYKNRIIFNTESSKMLKKILYFKKTTNIVTREDIKNIHFLLFNQYDMYPYLISDAMSLGIMEEDDLKESIGFTEIRKMINVLNSPIYSPSTYGKIMMILKSSDHIKNMMEVNRLFSQ